MKIRRLQEKDIPDVLEMDEESGFDVEMFVYDGNDTGAWGVFIKGTLIGYASMGYADCCGDIIENDIHNTSESKILSSVYIKPEYRNKGYASKLVEHILKNYLNETVYHF